LSKIAGLTVIARNSSFAFKGRAVDVRAIGRELGVRSVLEGSIRRAGRTVRGFLSCFVRRPNRLPGTRTSPPEETQCAGNGVDSPMRHCAV
jgi:hypothetical protein